MRVNEKHAYSSDKAEQAEDTVVPFPHGLSADIVDVSDEETEDVTQLQPRDTMLHALEYLFPRNKILTTGMPLAFDKERGVQVVQIAAVKRNDSYADVFFLVRMEDASSEAGYSERVLPMNGFRPEAAYAYIQRFVIRGKPLSIPSQCMTADENIVTLELRGVLLASLP